MISTKIITKYDRCLQPLLIALGWRGTRREFKEALPYYSEIKTVQMLNEVIENLGFSIKQVKANLSQIDESSLPCLFISKDKKPLILLGKEGEKLKAIDPESEEKKPIFLMPADQKTQGNFYIYKEKKFEEGKPDDASESWIHRAFRENKPFVYSVLGISLFLSLLNLAAPLFVMFTYNFVISTLSITMMLQFLIGICIALGGFALLGKLRSIQLSLMGAQVDQQIGNNIFKQLLYLSPQYTESASVASQVARLRDFAHLREFILGHLTTVMFEIPFITIGLIVIAAFGHWLVLVPIIALIIYFLLGLIIHPIAKSRIANSSQAGAKFQEFFHETLTKIKAIKYTASIGIWEKRHKAIAANALIAGFKSNILSGIQSAASDAITITSGMAILGFSAVKIINGTLSVGAMLAIMIITWRILTPIKDIFNAYTNVLQMTGSLKQISRLMQIQTEKQPSGPGKLNNIEGQIRFQDVGLRYPNARQPALVGVSFNIPAKKTCALIGRNGSGKSTILKLLLRETQQQFGSIYIDGNDIRQFNEIELRSKIAYIPHRPTLFFGSIAENIRLADPSVSEKLIHEAADWAGLTETIESLPKGFDTHISRLTHTQLPVNFRQELCIARALVKQAPIMLLDDPSDMLDKEGDERLMALIRRLHGKTTLLMCTHRPSHIKLMDWVVALDSGRIMMQGTADVVLPKVIKGLI